METSQERSMTTMPLRSPETMSVDDLLSLIAGCYQEAHRSALPELIALARKVEKVRQDAPEVPTGLADALEDVSLALDMHMQVEEEVLFTAMRQRIGGAIAHPIALMRSEHRDYAAALDAVQALAHDFVPPTGACSSWRRLYEGLAGLCATLREQMRLENDVLFARFDIDPSRCICAQG
jgi:regulator of cell morphogenesis and NO signaling